MVPRPFGTGERSQAAYGPLFVVVSAWCGLALGPSLLGTLSDLAVLSEPALSRDQAHRATARQADVPEPQA